MQNEETGAVKDFLRSTAITRNRCLYTLQGIIPIKHVYFENAMELKFSRLHKFEKGVKRWAGWQAGRNNNNNGV